MATLPVNPLLPPLGPASSTHADSTWPAGKGSHVTVVVVVFKLVGQAPAPEGIGPSSTTSVIVVVPGAVHMKDIGSDGPTASSAPGVPTPPVGVIAPKAPMGLDIVHV